MTLSLNRIHHGCSLRHIHMFYLLSKLQELSLVWLKKMLEQDLVWFSFKLIICQCYKFISKISLWSFQFWDDAMNTTCTWYGGMLWVILGGCILISWIPFQVARENIYVCLFVLYFNLKHIISYTPRARLPVL